MANRPQSKMDASQVKRKSSQNLAMDKLEKQVSANAAKYVTAAYKQAIKSGHRVLIVDGDRLVQVDAKNQKTLIHNVPPAVKIPKGTTYKLK